MSPKTYLFLSRLMLGLACVGAILAGYAIVGNWSKSSYYYRSPVEQSSGPYCGLIAVATICSMFGQQTNLSEIYLHAGVTEAGTTLVQCQQAMSALGISNEIIYFKSLSELREQIPILCSVSTGPAPAPTHAVVIYRIGPRVLVFDGQHAQASSVESLDKVAIKVAIVPRVSGE